MERDLVGKRPSFHQERKRTSFYRIMILLGLIVASVWIMLGWGRGEITSPLDPTPTPTRISESFFLEARAYFEAGKLDDPSNATPGPGIPPINDAIEAYQAALQSGGSILSLSLLDFLR